MNKILYTLMLSLFAGCGGAKQSGMPDHSKAVDPTVNPVSDYDNVRAWETNPEFIEKSGLPEKILPYAMVEFGVSEKESMINFSKGDCLVSRTSESDGNLVICVDVVIYPMNHPVETLRGRYVVVINEELEDGNKYESSLWYGYSQKGNWTRVENNELVLQGLGRLSFQDRPAVRMSDNIEIMVSRLVLTFDQALGSKSDLFQFDLFKNSYEKSEFYNIFESYL